ncbi:MAG: dienelactone hydrolase family protein [Tannerella sp.]|jgi:dienelactone hydrolase|nr:dienelactone hydrolase family protein [Tannerella sp.]
MFKYRILYILAITVFLTVKCTNPSFEITGVVQNGLNGEPAKGTKVCLQGTGYSTVTNKNGDFKLKIPLSTYPAISIEDINTTSFIKKRTPGFNMTLIAEKKGFQSLEYHISSRLSNLSLGILPEPPEFNASDYSGEYLPFTTRLEKDVQWENIIDGVRLFYEKRVESEKEKRKLYWERDLSSPEAYEASIKSNREQFRKILGAIDERVPVSMKKLNKVSETDLYTVYEVHWPVLKEIVPRPALQNWPELDVPRQIFGEGLLLEPRTTPKGYTIAIPDADQHPEDLAGLSTNIQEESQFARHLAENGYTVVIPVIIDRTNRWSRGTDRPSRTWIYSQAHEMGRTVAGYEIQKIEAVVDWFEQQGKGSVPIGIAGYGEGGLLAFYTAALDIRIKAALVSGYFAPREKIWQEPIYRNVWGLLKMFGDAEIANLIAPRSLVVEYSDVPVYDGTKNEGKKIEPPGELWTHSFDEVESEFNRIVPLTGKELGKQVFLEHHAGKTLPAGSEKAMLRFMNVLGHVEPTPLSDVIPEDTRKEVDFTARMGRMVEQMVGHTQLLLRDSEYVRKDFVKTLTGPEKTREFFRQELTGWLDDDFSPVNARTKRIDEQPGYTCYDVLIDVFPDVELWGILTIPKGIKPDEKRPVIVLQHGRGGNPMTAMSEKSGYFEVGRKMADRGFVVFTPLGNWTGETRFRWIDRIAKPLKNTLWSNVGRQHEQLIRWFGALPFIDTSRIALYGKSIGGQAASLIASMVPEYSMSINCAYFNESARKETTVYFPTGFVYHVDSEMPMWNRGHTMEYAEISNYLIFPRPFMVEHGKKDGIAPPGWVEHEYAKIKEYYEQQGKGDLTDLDLHEGGHIINGIKTYPFLHKHLNWPEP